MTKYSILLISMILLGAFCSEEKSSNTGYKSDKDPNRCLRNKYGLKKLMN